MGNTSIMLTETSEINNKDFTITDKLFKEYGWHLAKNEINFICYTKLGHETDVFDIQILMHGQNGASIHSVVTGTYVLPTHFTVYVNKCFVPPRLLTAHVTHVSCESIGVALLGPQF